MDTNDPAKLELNAAIHDQQFSDFSLLLELDEAQMAQIAGGKRAPVLPPTLV